MQTSNNQYLKIEVILENSNFVAINKPANIVVHPDNNHKNGTLIQEIVKKYPDIKNIGDDPINRPGVIHRLDKETSGVILIARSQKSFDFLKKQFQDRVIKKTYIALLYGQLGRKIGEIGIIDTPIARSAKNPILRTTKGKIVGEFKNAITEYKIIKHFHADSPREKSDFTLVKAYPKTGRTHQIRVHFSSIGHPVVCDKLYAKKDALCPKELNRHFLHASSLEFTDLDGARLKLEAEMPKDLQIILKTLI